MTPFCSSFVESKQPKRRLKNKDGSTLSQQARDGSTPFRLASVLMVVAWLTLLLCVAPPAIGQAVMCYWEESGFKPSSCASPVSGAVVTLTVRAPFSKTNYEYSDVNWYYDGAVTTNKVKTGDLRINVAHVHFASVTVSNFLRYEEDVSFCVIETGSIGYVYKMATTTNKHLFVGKTTTIKSGWASNGISVVKVPISESWYRYTTKTTDQNVCTVSTTAANGFVEADCKTHYLDPKYVVLVTSQFYSNATARWDTVLWSFRQNGVGGSVHVAAVTSTQISTDAFFFTQLESPTVVLKMAPTFAVIVTGSVDMLSCSKCTEGTIINAGVGVIKDAAYASVPVNETIYRYMRQGHVHSKCTWAGGQFSEYDCSQPFTDGKNLDLVVRTATLQSDQVWRSASLEACGRGANTLSIRVSGMTTVQCSAFFVASLTTPALRIEGVPEDVYIGAGAIGGVACPSCRDGAVLFVGQTVEVPPAITKAPIGDGLFRYTTRKRHTTACTVRSESTAFDEFDCELTFAGVEKWVDFTVMDLLVDCTGVAECVMSKNVLNQVFARLVVEPNGTSLRVSTPVRVKSLAVNGTLVGAFVVGDELSFEVKEEDVGNRLNIVAGSGAVLTVTDGGEDVTATETPLFLFAGKVLGEVPNLLSVTCGATTYWAYTTAESVACVCWAKGEALSDKYEGNWCGKEFALGVRKSTLFLDDNSDYIKNGIFFGTDNVTLTTNTSEYIVATRTIDAPDTLVVAKGVSVAVESITAGRVLDIAALVMPVGTQATRIVQTGDSLAVTIRHLDGSLVLEGSAVTASVGDCTDTSTVTINGTVSLSTECGVRLTATDGRAVTVHDSIITLDTADPFTLVGTNVTARVVNAHVALNAFSGVFIGNTSSTFSFDAEENVDVVVAGDGCDVSLGAKGASSLSVSFVEKSPCKGLSKTSDAQRSRSPRRRWPASRATTRSRSGRRAT